VSTQRSPPDEGRNQEGAIVSTQRSPLKTQLRRTQLSPCCSSSDQPAACVPDEGGNQHALSEPQLLLLRGSRMPTPRTRRPGHERSLSVDAPVLSTHRYAPWWAQRRGRRPGRRSARRRRAVRRRAAIQRRSEVISMQSACNQHAISMQSACNQHAISMQSEGLRSEGDEEEGLISG
jgi:hypothetical protein